MTGNSRWRAPVLAAAAIVAVVAAITPAPAYAYETSAYSHDAHPKALHEDWMAGLPDDLRLSELSLPGTHDSGASKFGGDITFTQSMGFSDQLAAGIRALDIRVGENGVCPLDIFHGIDCQFTPYGEVVADLVEFLDEHPSETIVTRVKNEHGNPSFAEVKALLEGHYYDGTDTDPELGDLRGKIVVYVEDFDPIGPFSWSDANLDIEDHFKLDTERDLAVKWTEYVAPHLAEADRVADDPAGRIFITFTSAADGGFPYFYASGHSSPATDADQLLTGWTRGHIDSCKHDSKCLREYPSVNCFLGTCSVEFVGLNQLTMDYVRTTVRDRAGIVYSDFPGPGLIEAVIALNVPGSDLPDDGSPHDVVHVLQSALDRDELTPRQARLAARVIADLWGSGKGSGGWQDLAARSAVLPALTRLADAVDALDALDADGLDTSALQGWLADAAADLAVPAVAEAGSTLTGASAARRIDAAEARLAEGDAARASDRPADAVDAYLAAVRTVGPTTRR
ncbi:hypothetical protein [Agromyces binzhouensis]|uniref:hypothetical protein n=1 Tax=Agromyces binzhouensis TaxID=1817495 RepID=UPI003631CA76